MGFLCFKPVLCYLPRGAQCGSVAGKLGWGVSRELVASLVAVQPASRRSEIITHCSCSPHLQEASFSWRKMALLSIICHIQTQRALASLQELLCFHFAGKLCKWCCLSPHIPSEFLPMLSQPTFSGQLRPRSCEGDEGEDGTDRKVNGLDI